MKMAVFFLAGVIVGFLALWGLNSEVTPAYAEDSASTEEGLQLPQLPDVKQIYDACLTEPFKQAETEIRDPDIANFYHNLMEKTGLTSDTDQ